MREGWNVDTRTVKTDSIVATRARAVATKMNRKTLQNFPAGDGYKYAFTSGVNLPDPTPTSEIISPLREEGTKSYPFRAKIVT